MKPTRSHTNALALLAVAALAAAGCGSSSTTATTQTATTATAPRSSGLKANTTPRFASPSQSAPVQSGTVKIAYRNIAIDPDTVRVKVGTKIVWSNEDEIEHNVTSAGGPQRFSSGGLRAGRTYSIVAAKPGVIHYLCTIHPTTMNGTIEVLK